LRPEDISSLMRRLELEPPRLILKLAGSRSAHRYSRARRPGRTIRQETTTSVCHRGESTPSDPSAW
jgi:hypothetical protein